MRLLPLAVVLLAASRAFAQEGDEVPPELAALEGRIVSITPAEAKMGDTVVAKVELVSPKGWHIYGLAKGTSGAPTEFKVTEGPFRVGAGVKEPAPKVHDHTFENGYRENYSYHEGTVVFEVPLEVTGDAKPGNTKVTISVHTMLCTMAVCLDEADTTYSATMKIVEGGVAKPPTVTDGAAQGGGGSPPKAAHDPKKGGFWAFIGLSILTGLATLVTPCVFPMIPVTISFFTKQASGARSGTFALAAAYGIGIVVSYTAIGLIVSAALGVEGANDFAKNAWVNITICIIFVIFAFSLFGWFELALPGFITDKLSAQGKSGYIGALLLGLTFSITAFTCAAPFLGSLLLLSVNGDWTWSLFGFLTYSGTMAVPFIALGLFPSLLKALPRSGGWLNSVKVVLGFVELAAACKFLANADDQWNWHFVSRSYVLAFWTACSVAAALYLFRVFRLKDEEPIPEIGVPRMLWGIVFAGFALFCASGLFGRHLGIVEALLPLPEQKMWLGEGPSGGSETGGGHVEYGSYSQALAAGKEQKKPVFLEFTAFS
ncbi:MAG: cytochrome c biogenesis protein CcdA [Planctomycetota bacterium]